MTRQYQPAATLTIKGASKMSKRGRASIAKWLKKQAFALELFADQYSNQYRARYLFIRK